MGDCVLPQQRSRIRHGYLIRLLFSRSLRIVSSCYGRGTIPHPLSCPVVWSLRVAIIDCAFTSLRRGLRFEKTPPRGVFFLLPLHRGGSIKTNARWRFSFLLTSLPNGQRRSLVGADLLGGPQETNYTSSRRRSLAKHLSPKSNAKAKCYPACGPSGTPAPTRGGFFYTASPKQRGFLPVGRRGTKPKTRRGRVFARGVTKIGRGRTELCSYAPRPYFRKGKSAPTKVRRTPHLGTGNIICRRGPSVAPPSQD